jgi:hypothetical protein
VNLGTVLVVTPTLGNFVVQYPGEREEVDLSLAPRDAWHESFSAGDFRGLFSVEYFRLPPDFTPQRTGRSRDSMKRLDSNAK